MYKALEDLVHVPAKLTESKPLFESEEDYQKFIERHKSHDAKYADLKNYAGKAYLGIDSVQRPQNSFYSMKTMQFYMILIHRIREIH